MRLSQTPTTPHVRQTARPPSDGGIGTGCANFDLALSRTMRPSGTCCAAAEPARPYGPDSRGGCEIAQCIGWAHGSKVKSFLRNRTVAASTQEHDGGEWEGGGGVTWVWRRTPAAAAAEGLPDEEKKNRCAAGRGASEVAKWAGAGRVPPCWAAGGEEQMHLPSAFRYHIKGKPKLHSQ